MQRPPATPGRGAGPSGSAAPRPPTRRAAEPKSPPPAPRDTPRPHRPRRSGAAAPGRSCRACRWRCGASRNSASRPDAAKRGHADRVHRGKIRTAAAGCALASYSTPSGFTTPGDLRRSRRAPRLHARGDLPDAIGAGVGFAAEHGLGDRFRVVRGRASPCRRTGPASSFANATTRMLRAGRSGKRAISVRGAEPRWRCRRVIEAISFAPRLAVETLEILAKRQATDGRCLARRRAGQDPARAPDRRDEPDRRAALRAVLRLGRLDAAVADPARRDPRLDRRRRARRPALAQRPRRARVDRRLGRSRRRRLRRVRARAPTGPPQPGLEGLGRRRSAGRTGRSPRPRSPWPRSRATSSTPSGGWRGWPAAGRRSTSPTGSSRRQPTSSSVSPSSSCCRDGYIAMALDARQEAGRRGGLERRALPVERDRRAERARRAWRTAARLPAMSSGWGVRTYARGPARLQPDRLSHRHGLAARHGDRGRRAAALRLR